jgi:hypothetical protein
MRDIYMGYRGAVLSMFILLISACTSLGLTPPQTFNQKLAYAYGSVTSVRLVAKNLLVKSSITTDDAQNVQAQADVAKQSLDAARVASGSGDVTTAQDKLVAAQSILAVLESFLRSRGGNI